LRNQGFNAEEYRFFLNLDFQKRVFPLTVLLAIAFVGLAFLNKSQFGNEALGLIDTALALIFIGVSVFLRLHLIAPMRAMVVVLSLLIFHVGLTIVSSGTMHGVLFYYCVIPFVALYMTGARVGLMMSFTLLLMALVMLILSLGGHFSFGYSSVELGYFLFLLSFSIAAAWLFESIREGAFYSAYREGIRYDRLMEAIDEVYYRVGLDGLIQELGDAIISLTGWHPREVVGRHIEMFYADPEERKAYVEALTKNGSVKNYPIAILGKYGQRVMISMSSRVVTNDAGQPQYIEGMFRDITKEVKLDYERQKHLDHVQTLSLIDTYLAGSGLEAGIEQTMEALLHIFSAQRAFLVPMTDANTPPVSAAYLAAAPGFTHFDPLAFIGLEEVKHALLGLPKPSAQQPTSTDDIGLLATPLRQTHQIHAHALTLMALSNQVVWVLCLQQCASEAEGLSAQHKLLIDITHRLRGALEQLDLQRSLQETAIRAESASKAKSDFLATMSHELRTPLHGVIGLLDLLNSDVRNLHQEQRNNLNLAQSSAHVLSALIDDILDLSKIESGHIVIENTNFNLEKTIREALVPFVVRAKEKNINLSFEMIDVAEIITGDASRLRQVLLNLVGNAVKFTHEGYVRIVVEQDAKSLYISVEDSGIGIEEKKQDLVFQPFVQVHDIQILGDNLQEKGTGLGTTIAQQFVAMMGGSISLHSAPKVGTTMRMTLPLRQVGETRVTVSRWLEDLVDVGEPSSMANQHDKPLQFGAALKVLLAEDDPVGRMVALKRLERAGFEVTVVADGEAAWLALQQQDFDLLLTDVRMPGLNGIQLTSKVRAKEQEQGKVAMLIMGLSAFALEDVKNDALQSGMNAFISKPVDMQALMQKLKESDLVNTYHD